MSRPPIVQSKRYHVHNDYTGLTYFTFDTLAAANVRRDHEQNMADYFKVETNWYVVDTYA